MSVRAKFVVETIDRGSDGDGSVMLRTVYGDNPENKQFFRWTPSGMITMAVVNKLALDQFEVGREFYVDFTAAT